MRVRRFIIATLMIVASAFVGMSVAILTRPATRLPDATESPGAGWMTSASSDPFDLLPYLNQPLNILVMGTDLELIQQGKAYVPTLNGRTDTVLLVHVSPEERKVRAVSIPRDTRVFIPGKWIDKINAANVYGGPKLAEQTVADYLNVPIDRYVRINTFGVVQTIDTLGGVTLYIPERMHYNDFSQHLYINFNRGWHHLNGQQAQAYIRFRHDALADIGRIQRQQQFIRAMMDQVFTPATVLKVPQLLRIVRDNLDTDLSSLEIFRLMRWAKDLDRKNVEIVMLPGDFSPGAGTYWIGNPARIDQFLQRFRYTSEATVKTATASPEFRPQRFSITVRDGVGSRQNLRRFMASLREQGYVVVNGGSIAGTIYAWPVATTQIIAQKGENDVGERIRQSLGVGEVVTSSVGDLLTDFTVIMGQDWVKMNPPPSPSPSPLKAVERSPLRQRRGHVSR